MEKWEIVVQANGWLRYRPGVGTAFAFKRLCDPDFAMWWFGILKLDENTNRPRYSEPEE